MTRLIIAVCACAALAGAQSVPEAKVESSLRKMFGDSVAVRRSPVVLARGERDSLGAAAGSFWRNDTIDLYTCTSAGATVGYGVTDNVMGKAQYITYLVGLGTTGAVRDVDILAYREAYGGEVAYEAFRKQFRDKTASDRLQPGRDIKNISGATISARAVTLGVKRIVMTFDRIRGRIR